MGLYSVRSIWVIITIFIMVLVIYTDAQRFQQRFRQNNNVNFRRNNNQQGQNGFNFGLDTSDGRYARFDGPVRGLPPGHGGGRFGAADCLLCGR